MTLDIPLSINRWRDSLSRSQSPQEPSAIQSITFTFGMMIQCLLVFTEFHISFD